MASPLIATKMHVPRVRRGLVARPRLIERLSRAARCRLTLVSAPAGFGKTTLLSSWLGAVDAGQPAVAWLSLDENDSQPALFWSYVAAALQGVGPGVGAGAETLLQSASAPVEAVVASLINDLGAVEREIYLVLDDYHLVDGSAVEAGMALLVERLPLHAHVVIVTRADPSLPLARLRARGELVEIRAADLRFTLDEAVRYFNDVAGLNLTGEDVAELEGRTEGWIAALQLAALSMQGRADVTGFVAAFAGDDRYIVDFLVEEVLRRQPERVQRFLLQTSILDRLCGPLCDAVTVQPGGSAMLESLDRANLFLVPLDDSRRWYRYHHLFADVLRLRLQSVQGGEVADLHRRASHWFDENGEPVPAVGHALAVADMESAAGLVERAVPVLLRQRQESTIRGWVHAFPEAVVRTRPVLAVGLIAALMSLGEFEGVAARLREVEQALELAPHGLIAADMTELRRVPAQVQLYRAALALVQGDIPATLTLAGRALEQTGPDDHVTRAGASAVAGLAYWGRGELEAAHQAYAASVVGLRQAGHVADVLGCSITLADLRLTQGRLDEALRTCEQALRLAAERDGAVLRGTADMYVVMCRVAFERNDLEAATGLLQRSQQLGERAGLPQNPYRWRVAKAQVVAAQGDLDGALQLLGEAERVYVGDFLPNVRPVPAVRARLLAAHGRVAEALRWVKDRGLSADDDVSYLQEFEHVTLARVLLMQHRVERGGTAGDKAARLLEGLLSAAEIGARTGSAIEILVLLALTHHARGDVAAALICLERALRLAEPEGYVRVFLSEGKPMPSLLRAIAEQAASWAYVNRLVHAGADGRGRRAPHTEQGLVEPLSDRELTVLRLLGSDLSGPAIARELVVSLNTLRTHTRNIYAKLGVNSRREAVRRAAALHLLPHRR